MKTLKFSAPRFLPILAIMLIWFFYSPIYGQTLMTVKHSCNFDGEEASGNHYVFEASAEATKIINTIVQANGLSANSFIVKESNCKNALATTDNKKRFILYNPLFLQKFKADAKSKWVGYCVLAHEIAHHLNGHDLETTDPIVRKQQELEADIYAGHWLYKMGASLEEAQAGINAIPLENETNTHPPKNARLVAVTNGWRKAKELVVPSEEKNSVPPIQSNPENDKVKEVPKTTEPTNPPARTNPKELHGDILAKWIKMGYEKSPVGYPVTDELPTPDGVGRFNHFDKGSMYWHPNNPGDKAFMIYGAIRDKWAVLGWELSPLGYPITDELSTPDQKGRFNTFSYGGIYFNPTIGTFAVYGDIYKKWISMGAERGVLGYPISDEKASDRGDFARMNVFQNGKIYWKLGMIHVQMN